MCTFELRLNFFRKYNLISKKGQILKKLPRIKRNVPSDKGYETLEIKYKVYLENVSVHNEEPTEYNSLDLAAYYLNYDNYNHAQDIFYEYDIDEFETPQALSDVNTMKIANFDKNLDKFQDAPWQVIIQGWWSY